MSIAFEVLRAIRALRDTPGGAGEILRQLEAKAKKSLDDNFVAIMAPKADRTWDAVGTLASTQAESGQFEIEFPRPIEILGFHTVIVPASFAAAPPLVVPTLQDLMMSVAYNQENIITNQSDQTAGAGPTQFINADSMELGLPRLTCLRIETPTPKLQIKYRPKQGAGVFVDSIITVSTFVKYL